MSLANRVSLSLCHIPHIYTLYVCTWHVCVYSVVMTSVGYVWILGIYTATRPVDISRQFTCTHVYIHVFIYCLLLQWGIYHTYIVDVYVYTRLVVY